MAVGIVKASNGLQLQRWLHPKYWGMWLFFAFLRIVTLFPLRWIEAIGTFLGWLLYRLAPSRRRICRINIKQAYPEYTEADIKYLIKSSYKSLGISIFEMALAWWAKRSYLRAHCEVEGMQHLEQALAKGKGVIMLTGHFSTLEIGGILMALYTPLNAVYKKAHNPMFNTFMDFYRNKHLQEAIPSTNVRGFIKGLRNGVATWYAPDQDFTQNIVFAPFLGGTAGTLTSTAKMADMTGASVVPFYPQRLNKGKGYKLVILPALENFPCGNQVDDASSVNHAIETMVRKNPEQYVWIHKRFKTQPEGKTSIY